DMPKSPVRGNIHPLAKAGLDQGSVSGSTVMHHITIFFDRTLEQQSDLDRLLKEQQDPSSANYHKWLSAPEYALRFGLSEGDFQKVTTWLQEHGFSIVEKANSRSYVVFSGSAEQVQSAFGIQIHR